MSGRGAGSVASRFLTVASDRLPGWVSRYTAARDQAVTALPTPTGLELVGVDGSRAQLALLDPSGWVATSRSTSGGTATPDEAESGVAPGPALDALVEALVADALRPRALLVALVRRGGWTVGVVESGRVLTGATGRRYVQGGTAAGGWSQQRFARRRQGQSAKLADDATAALGRVLSQTEVAPTALVWGGDRALLDSVVAGTPVAELPRLGPLEVGEPRRVDLEQSAERVLGLRVTVFDAPV